MLEVCEMTVQDAERLNNMMQEETANYMQHFTAFSVPGALLSQYSKAKKDRFFSLRSKGYLAGFFCLRGWDAGYDRPSFGVYVAHPFKGQGLASLALTYMLEWCCENQVGSVLLKVSEFNTVARKLYEKVGFVPAEKCPDTGHIMMVKEVF